MNIIADGATKCGYAEECLPFTGLEVVIIAIFGVALVATGWWIRRIAKDKKGER